MSTFLDRCPALVLNADFRPLSYYPLSLWNWRDAVNATLGERVQVVAEYPHRVRAPRFSMALPSVIALKDYVRQDGHPAFTRFNVFLRDLLCCQYCGGKFRAEELTFDHVTPRRQGGRTSWGNVVTACGPCNLRKGGRTPRQAQMPLKRVPEMPTARQLLDNGRNFPPNFLHESWGDYLYWDSVLEG